MSHRPQICGQLYIADASHGSVLLLYHAQSRSAPLLVVKLLGLFLQRQDLHVSGQFSIASSLSHLVDTFRATHEHLYSLTPD